VPSLVLPARWRKQPQGIAQIDWTHPLARGLVYFAVGNETNAPDLVTGALASPIGTSRIVAGAAGLGYNSSTTDGTRGWSHPLGAPVKAITTDFTVAMLVDVASLPLTAKLLSIPYQLNTYTTPFTALALGRSASGSRLAISVTDSATTTKTFAPPDSSFTLTGLQTLVGTRSGAAASFYRNGVDCTVNTNTLTTAPMVFGAGDTVSLLNHSAKSPGENCSATVHWAGLWNRALSADEQRELHYAPYQFVRPASTRAFSFATLVSLPPVRSGAAASSCPRPAASATAARTGVPDRSAAKPAGTLALARTGPMAGATGYWAFQESSGAAVNLAAPGTGNAAIQSAASRGTDALGAYLACAKNTGSYASTGLTGTALGIGGAAARTVFCRFRASSQAYANDATLGTYTGGLWYYGANSAANFLSFRQASPTNPPSDLWLANTGATPANAEITITPTVNTVHTAVLTYDGATLRTYVDGTLRQEVAVALNTLDTVPFDIGRMSIVADRWNFQGRVYEVGVVAGTAWDASQVAAYDANPVLNLSGSGTGDEFTSEFTFEFGTSNAANRAAAGTASTPRATTAATGARAGSGRTAAGSATVPKASTASAATRTVPARTATGIATVPAASTASAAARTIPDRAATGAATVPKASAASTATRAIPARTATGTATTPRTAAASAATRTIPARTGTGAAAVPMAAMASAATRTIPARTATSAAAASLPAAAATGTRGIPGAVGTVQSVLPVGSSAAAGARSIPARTAAAGAAVPMAATAATAARTIPARTATGTATTPRAATSTLGARSSPATLGYAAEVLADAPRLYWRFDTTSGTVPDASGNGFAGTAGGLTTANRSAAGPLSGQPTASTAFEFIGDGDYVSAPTATATALNIDGTKPKTVECWVRADGLGITYVGAWEIGTRSGGQYMALCHTDSETAYSVNTYGPNATWTGPGHGVWQLVHVTYDPTDAATPLKAYVNATRVLASATTVNLGSAVPLLAGYLDGRPWVGLVAELAVYDKALPTDRMAAHLAAASGATATDTTGAAASAVPPARADAAALRTIPPRTATAAAAVPAPSTASAATRSAPPRAGTSAASVPVPTAVATASRTIPGRTASGAATLPRAATSSAATRTIPARTATGTAAVQPARTDATALRGAPGVVGAAQAAVPSSRTAATAARTVPDRTATGTSALPRPGTAASAARVPPPRAATSATVVPFPRTAVAGTTGIPVFTGASAAAVPAPRSAASAARTIPDRAATSATVVPFPRTAAAAVRRPTPRTATSDPVLPAASTALLGRADAPLFAGTGAGLPARPGTTADGTASPPLFRVVGSGVAPVPRAAATGRHVGPQAAELAGGVWLTGTVAYEVHLRGAVQTA